MSLFFLLLLWQLSRCSPVDATVEVAGPRPQDPPEYNALIDNGTFGYYPVRTYATEPDLSSPQVNFLQWDSRCDDGFYYFFSPRGWSLPDPGPMILDARGELVWTKHFDNKFGGQAYDFRVQTYNDEEYLTFWLGDDRVRGHGSGSYYMLNSSYDVVHRVSAANGLTADLHEFLITDDGTALMTIYEVVEYDLTDFPGYEPDPEHPDDPTYIWDCLFQEINIDTGTLVFEWRASDHVKLSDTYRGIGPGGSHDDPFDWFHINSIQKDDFGNYLLSSRYTHSITYVDGATGNTIWTLGGPRNDFMDLSGGDALNFAWQHDARFIPIDTFPNMHHPSPPPDGYVISLLTLFDNAAEDGNHAYGLDHARGLVLEVTYPVPDGYRVAKGDGEDVIYTRERRTRRKNTRDTDVTNGDKNEEEEQQQQQQEEEVEEVEAEKEEQPEEQDVNALKLEAINGTNPAFTVRLVKSYANPESLRSSSQGSFQVLEQTPEDDPKVLMSMGLDAAFTEFSADGTVLCNVHYGANTSWETGDIQSYRIYKFPWYGEPEVRPKIEISDDDSEVFVSWNGATEVSHWILQCADSDADDEANWADVVWERKRGFETLIPLSEEVGESRYLRVIAIDRHQRRLEYGTSEVIDRGPLVSYFPTIMDELPHGPAGLTPVNIMLILLVNMVVIYILFDLYRRYLSWRMSRPHAGVLRWRNGTGYRLLGDA